MATLSIQAASVLTIPIPNWANAMATFSMAKADLEASGDEDEEIDFYADAQLEAMEALLMMPAPDARALASKIEVFIAQDCSSLNRQIREPLLAALMADAVHLAGEE